MCHEGRETIPVIEVQPFEANIVLMYMLAISATKEKPLMFLIPLYVFNTWDS